MENPLDQPIVVFLTTLATGSIFTVIHLWLNYPKTRPAFITDNALAHKVRSSLGSRASHWLIIITTMVVACQVMSMLGRPNMTFIMMFVAMIIFVFINLNHNPHCYKPSREDRDEPDTPPAQTDGDDTNTDTDTDNDNDTDTVDDKELEMITRAIEQFPDLDVDTLEYGHCPQTLVVNIRGNRHRQLVIYFDTKFVFDGVTMRAYKDYSELVDALRESLSALLSDPES